MKLQISSREFSRVLTIASKAIRAKNSLAILDNAVIQRKDDGTYTVTGGSEQATITLPTTFSLISGKDSDFRPIAVKPDYILPVISSLSDQPLTLTLDYNADGAGFMKIERISGNMRIPFQSASEYPDVPPLDTPELSILSISAQQVIALLNTARPFCANDELRMVMNGVCLDACGKEISFVSTNGHKLFRHIICNTQDADGNDSYKFSTSLVQDSVSIIVNSQLIAPIPLAFADADAIDIIVDGKQILFRSGDIEYVCRRIEGRYPNYKAVIPANNNFTIVLNKKELISAIKRVMIFASESTQMIKFSKQGMLCTVSGEDIDFSTSAKEDVTIIDSNLNDGYAIGLKAPFLLETLSCITGEEVLLQFGDPAKPALIKENDPKATRTCLVMPMLLQE